MKLAVAAPLYPPESGGPATYVRNLENGLPPLGDEMTIVKFSEVRKYPKIIRHMAYFFHMMRAAYRADIVLALDPVSTGLPASIAARLLGKPYVVKVVGDFAWEQGNQRFGIKTNLDTFVREKSVPLPVMFFRSIQTHVARHARKIIVPSQYLKNIVVTWGIDPDKITVIYNAVESEETGIVPEVAEVSKPRVVTTGRLVPWKGILGLIDAFAELSAEFPTATLTVIGEGPDHAMLTEYANKKAPGKVFFIGAQSHQDTLAIMKESDVFVLNSSYEGLSHVLIESLLMGCATVASTAGGNPEVITHNDNGLLVSVGDTVALAAAIRSILADSVLHSRLKSRALQTSERFSILRMLTQTHELIASLI